MGMDVRTFLKDQFLMALVGFMEYLLDYVDWLVFIQLFAQNMSPRWYIQNFDKHEAQMIHL